jgi:hypothetical protein
MYNISARLALSNIFLFGTFTAVFISISIYLSLGAHINPTQNNPTQLKRSKYKIK